MGFQKTVLIVALVILTLAIIVMSTIISSNESKKKWPPEVATCPPFYKATAQSDGSINCVRDVDAPKIGSGTASATCANHPITVSGDNSKFISDNANCTWANTCKIQWDGISASNCDTRDKTQNPVTKVPPSK